MDHDQIILIRLQSMIMHRPQKSHIALIIHAFHIVSKKCYLSVSVLQKIFCHVIACLLIIQPYIHIICHISRCITVDQNCRFLIFTLNPGKIIMEHSKEDQPIHIPGGNIAHQFIDIIRNIEHEKISSCTYFRFNRAHQISKKRICDQIVASVFSSLNCHADNS